MKYIIIEPKMTRKIISKLWVQGILCALKSYIKLMYAIHCIMYFLLTGLKL